MQEPTEVGLLLAKKSIRSSARSGGGKSKKLKKKRPETPAVVQAVAVEDRPVAARPERIPSRPRTVAPVQVVDYHYVLSDLKRIGVTSAAIVALLVVLSLILR